MSETRRDDADDHDYGSLFSGNKKTKKTNHFSEGLRVCLIDDNVVCLQVLAFQLHKCGFQVTATTKASEAIEMLRKNKDGYDIVITDVMRSDMDGFQLLPIIGLELAIPVIITSADGDIRTVEKSVKSGACDYLVKPVRMEILRNIWQHVIRKKVHTPRPGKIEAKRPRNTELSRKHMRSEDESSQSSEELHAQKKSRVVWRDELHKKFVAAVEQLGLDGAVPKRILEIMNEPQLTRESVASHLQKYRNALKKQKESSSQETNFHIDKNGIHNVYNHIIHESADSHGFHAIGHNNSYVVPQISSFIGQTPLLHPFYFHDNLLQQPMPPPQDVDEMQRTPITIPMLRNMVNHHNLPISSQLTPIGSQNLGPFTMIVSNSSLGNKPILGTRSHAYAPGVFNYVGDAFQMSGDISSQVTSFPEPDSLLVQVPVSPPGYQEGKSLVILSAEGGSHDRGGSSGSQHDMQAQVGGSSGNDQISYKQHLMDSPEIESNGHHMHNSYLDDDIGAIVSEFSCNSAPRIDEALDS